MTEPLNAAFVPDPNEMARCFLGAPRRELLPFAYELYRFNTGRFGSSARVTPWWCSVKGLAPGDGLDALRERAGQLHAQGFGMGSPGVSEAGFARATRAVSNPWNDMDTLVLARLNHEAYAWIGRARSQLFDAGSPGLANVSYIGGGWQIYLPNLSREDLFVIS